MDKKAERDEHLPSDSKEISEKGEENREKMDRVPEHGTDPLHEGP